MGTVVTKEIRIEKANAIAVEYFALLAQLYGNSESAKSYVCDTQNGLNKICTARSKPLFIFAKQQNRLIGHIALIPFRENEAFFGFFECVDEDCYVLLWNYLVYEAKKLGAKSLFGPVNGTIWHPYRFVTRSTEEPFFPSEPLSRIEYFNWFAKQNPSKVIEYHSAFRTDFTPIINATRSSYQCACENDIVIGVESPGVNTIKDLYSIAVGVFSQNPGYSHLSLPEFISLYSNEKLSENKSVLYTARHNNHLVGFCLNLEYNKTLIMKTIAVLPTQQKKGVGNAMVHKIHIDAIKAEKTKVIYALVRKDNDVRHFPTDMITVFREYSAYLYNI